MIEPIKVLTHFSISPASRKPLLHVGLFAAFALMVAPSQADYDPLSLHQLIRGSDLIVIGTISDVHEHSFILDNSTVLSGPTASKPLVIERYNDWTGSRRWKNYQSGQKVLLFLRKPVSDVQDRNYYWQIRGAGGEGEMPVEEDFIYPHGLNLKQFSRQKYSVQQGIIYGYRFELSTFLSAIDGYRRCFNQDEARDSEIQQPIAQICDSNSLENYRNESALHHHLVSVSIKEIRQD